MLLLKGLALEDNFDLLLTWFYFCSNDGRGDGGIGSQCLTDQDFIFFYTQMNSFQNETSLTSNEQNISNRKRRRKKGYIKKKKLQQYSTSKEYLWVEVGREMKIAHSFYDTWKKKKKEVEKGVPFLFSSQEQTLCYPQFLVSSEVTGSFA